MQYLTFPVSTPIPHVSCGNLVYETAWIHSERVIDTFEIIVGVKGEVYIQQDDEQYVVKPGSSLVLLPGHHHKGYAYSSEPISFFWAHFTLKSFSLLDEAAGMRKLAGIISTSYSRLSHQAALPLFHDSEPDSKLGILFHQLLHLRSNPVYTKLAADYAITSILIQLTQNITQDIHREKGKSAQSSTFEKSLEWLRDSFNEDISAKQAALRYHYNPNYYSRMFHARTGMRFMEYLNSLRVSKAKMLLYESDLSVKEIAGTVGFNDEKYFMRVFKAMEGISPARYRNAFYKTHQNKG
jgi:AraC-like DNA-binding protein